MPFTPQTAALLEQTIAARALTQLNRISIYPRTAVVDYEPGAFERGETVKIRRPKRRFAQDVDPRGLGLQMTEATFFSADVKLERLWGDGFLVYGHDPSQSIQKYVADTSAQMASSISVPNDDYLHDRFRYWTATTGTVELGANAPIQVVASVDDDGNFTDFDNNTLRAAGTVLDGSDVPASSRYAVLSSTAKGAFLGDSVVVTGFASALNLGSGQLIQTGLPNGEFVERYGFLVAGCNSVKGQTSASILGNAASAAVSSAAANTLFVYADDHVAAPVGAVNITLDGTGTTLGSGVGVGQLIRIRTSAGKIVGFGVILRIDTTTATAPVVTVVPYTPGGLKIPASEILAAMTVDVPAVPSVNTSHHMEGVIIGTRLIREPSLNSGARATSIVDPNSNLTIQIITGQYDIAHVSERNAYYHLTGARISDLRKCCLMLSR